MAVAYLTRVYHFNAGHRLFRTDRDSTWNWEVFGKCSYEGGHGHNYRLELTVRGVPDRATGFVVPVQTLDAAVEREVMDRIDHRNLNDILALRFAPAPTTEVLALELWDDIARHIPPPAKLYRIRVSETYKNAFEYFGPDPQRARLV